MKTESSSFKKIVSQSFALIFALSLSLPVLLALPIQSASAATYTVINTNDSGVGSLRQGIIDANANPGGDSIQLDPTINGTITLLSELPAITEDLIIDASTGLAVAGPELILDGAGMTWGLKFTAGTSSIKDLGIKNAAVCVQAMTGAAVTIGDSGTDGIVEIDGCPTAGIDFNGSTGSIYHTSIGMSSANGSGIYLQGAWYDITIGGGNLNESNVISNNTENGIYIGGSGNNVTIKGNTIGLNAAGDADNGNSKNGIYAANGANGVVIGGIGAGERNVISGNNWHGIHLEANSVAVRGNYIGTTAAGTAGIANSFSGIQIESSSNTIGGSTNVDGNIISGNTQNGIKISAALRAANSNIIRKNYIGTNAAGTAAIANVEGILIDSGALNTAIGGDSMGNLISGNSSNGIKISGASTSGTSIQGNTIGLAADGSTAVSNAANGIFVEGDSTIIGTANTAGAVNVISSNGSFGVDLAGADSSTIVNNYIGVNSDGTTANVNLSNAIQIENTGTLNTIGGTAAGAGNIIAAGANNCVNLAGTAGDYNSIRRNNCLSGTLMNVSGGNESIATPSINPASLISYLYGTAPASSSIELFEDGTYLTSTTSDGAGAWSVITSVTTGSTVHATATNATSSTSSSSAGVIPLDDITPPTVPTVSSPVDNSYLSATTSDITGTKEANSNILIGGVEQVALDALTTWTVSAYPLTEGVNTLSITSKDGANNTSGPLTLTVNRDTVTPTIPTLSYASSAAGTVTISGSGTEIGAYVLVYGGNTGLTVDALGNFSVPVSLHSGSNSITISIRDLAGNTSTEATATVTSTTGGGGPSGGGPTSPASTPSSPSVIQDNQINAAQENTTSIAGDTEISSPDYPVLTPVTPLIDTPAVNPAADQTLINDEKPEEEPQHSFFSGIYEFYQPIKAPSPRDNIPSEPVAPSKFDGLVQNGFFGEVNSLGLPEKIIEIKFGGVAPSPTRDSDGDGLYDYEEALYGGNPLVKDTDADGIDDLHEVYFGGTDPENYDTDGDGIADDSDPEPLVYNSIKVDPKLVTDYIGEEKITSPIGSIDSDEDGLSDMHELMLGTNPQDDDSDADGLKDGDEVLHLGTNPIVNTPATAVSSLKVVNMKNGEQVESGAQFIMGHGKPNEDIQVFELMPNGEVRAIAETESDEEGRFVVLTAEKLDEGPHSLFITSGGINFDDISSLFTLNVVKATQKAEFVGLGATNAGVIDIKRPTLSLKAGQNSMLVVAWRSTVYSQTLIADASEQTMNIHPAKDLELGEHTVTWYAVDMKSGEKSSPTQVGFTVTNTAFITGQTGTSPLTIFLGAVAILASLTALALFYRNRRMKV